MSFPVWNSDPSWNKITSAYFKDNIDLSGNFIIRNGTIRSPENTIEFDDTFGFINFVNSVNVLGQLKNTFNSVEYDVGLQCEKTDTLVSDVAILSPIVSDTQFKTTGFYWDAGLSSTVFNNNASFPNGSISSTAINNTSFVSKSGAETIDGIKTFNNPPVMSGASITIGTIPVTRVNGTAVTQTTANQVISSTKTFSVLQTFTNNIRLDGSLLVGTAGGTTITNAQLQNIADIGTLKTITTSISYTPATTTTLITGVLQYSGTFNGWDTTNFSNAINYARTATSDLQTQINNFTGVSLSADNTFSGSNIFSATLRLNNNLRLQGALLVDNGGTTITNATLKNLQYLANVSSDINTSITNLNTKTTNISFFGLTTTFGGLLSFPLNSISSGAIINDHFVALTGAQSVGGTKTYTSQAIFSNNIRLDTGSLILNSNTLTLNNANLQKIQFLSTVSGDIQTQINGINGISLSASNVFTGTTNQFQNSIRLDGSLVVNSNGTTLSNSTLNKIQYLSNITSDLSTSLQTLTDKMSGFYRSETTGTYFFTSNLNTEGKFNTLTPYEIGNLTGTTEPLQIAIDALKTKTDTTNTNLATTTTNANDALQRTTEISFSDTPTPQTNITSKCVTEELVFTMDLNDITPTTFGYLSDVTGPIGASLNSKVDTLQGTIIQHISSNLQSIFPTKYLLCNGQAVSRTTYNILFSIIGTTYGSGDGGTTYNVPNFESCFLRMYSSPRTFGGVVYTPSPVGTIQQDSMEAHVHSSNLSGSYLNNSTTTGSYFSFGTSRYNTTNFPSFGGGVSASHRTTSETRPLNHAVYFYITC